MENVTVTVSYNPDRVPREILGYLGKQVSIAVAAAHPALPKSEKPTSKDVEVGFVAHGPYDVNRKDLAIVVRADFSPKRSAALASQMNEIEAHIREFLAISNYPKHLTTYVQVVLQHAVLGEI